MNITTFPHDARSEKPYKNNPAIQIFGNRFFADQTPMEFLMEFLLIAISEKRFGGQEENSGNQCLPSREILNRWHNEPLSYAPKARLNLKLFSFLGISKLDSRHNTHIRQYKKLTDEFMQLIDMPIDGNRNDVVQALENLFLGFQGAGAGRTWCAQSFLPICRSFISGETIWKANLARKNRPQTWEDLFDNQKYFDSNQHLFFARGGEVLYLQICNALKRSPEEVKNWLVGSEIILSFDEQNPEKLHNLLEESLHRFLSQCPKTINEIAELIDEHVESATSEATDRPDEKTRFVSAGWCPTATWQEGYLFAVDLLRICQANLSLVDRIYLLETAFVIHVLRSMGMQSARIGSDCNQLSGVGFLWAFSAPEEDREAIKRVSHHSVKATETMIYTAIRKADLEHAEARKTIDGLRKDADKSYGGKLFLKLGKRIGLIIPRRGAGERFVLNEQILRFLVTTIVPLGGRLTFDTFKERAAARFGMVFDADGLARSAGLSGYGEGVHLPADTDYWLQDMLKAAGLLLQLSDSCSMVINPNGHK